MLNSSFMVDRNITHMSSHCRGRVRNTSSRSNWADSRKGQRWKPISRAFFKRLPIQGGTIPNGCVRVVDILHVGYKQMLRLAPLVQVTFHGEELFSMSPKTVKFRKELVALSDPTIK